MITRAIIAIAFTIAVTLLAGTANSANSVLNGLVIFQQQPVENLSINFPGIGSVITKMDGSFQLQLPPNYSLSSIPVQINDSLKILEPSNGLLIIPKNSDQTVLIRLGTIQEKKVFDLVQQEIHKLLEITEERSELQTDIILRKVEALLVQQQMNYDSIRKVMLSQQEYRLLIEKEKNRYRASLIVPVMDSVYDFYISRSKDLWDAFDRYGMDLFYNERTTHKVNTYIDNYTEAYELLNARKGFIVKNTEFYYDAALAVEIRNFIYTETLQYFHYDKVYSANALMRDISNFNERKRDRRKKSELKSDISEYLNDLRPGIVYISDNKVRLAQKMSNGIY